MSEGDTRANNEEWYLPRSRILSGPLSLQRLCPLNGRSRFWREDVKWYGVTSQADTSFDSHTLAFCLHGASHNDADIYVMINSYWEDLTFTAQEGAANEWRRVVETSLLSPQDIAEPGNEGALMSIDYTVKARSVVKY